MLFFQGPMICVNDKDMERSMINISQYGWRESQIVMRANKELHTGVTFKIKSFTDKMEVLQAMEFYFSRGL